MVPSLIYYSVGSINAGKVLLSPTGFTIVSSLLSVFGAVVPVAGTSVVVSPTASSSFMLFKAAARNSALLIFPSPFKSALAIKASLSLVESSLLAQTRTWSFESVVVVYGRFDMVSA